MGRPAVPTHWLRSNEREWTPAHVLYADTETAERADGDNLVLELRCWVAVRVDRREVRKTQPDRTQAEGTTRAGLADWVDEVTMARRSCWLFTHNLGFDLAVTDLVGELVRRGWTLGEWSANDRATWLRLSNGHRGLTLADSHTWLPAALERVASIVGVPKLALPDPGDSLEVWYQRCRSDVAILETAMGQLMDWWDRAGLGNWSVTGNGCGWNAMRHQVRSKTILVRRGDDGVAFERQAIYGGRRDATRWGDVPGGPFVTVDFVDTYPTIARHLRLPARRLDAFPALPLDSPHIGDGAVQAAARVRVRTLTPRYPLRWGGAVWYPTGTFETVLAGPELVDARDRGDLLEVGAGFRYWCDGHLSGWAAWVLDLAAGRVEGAPPVASLPGRRWGRSVIGRFAQRIGESEHWGPAMNVGWSVLEGADVTGGCPLRVVDLAGERWLVRQDQDADDCFPAVLAWVESACRVRLGRMVDEAGDRWVYCNTDGALLEPVRAPARRRSAGSRGPAAARCAVEAAAAFCDRLAPSTWPLVPRPKDSHGEVWLAGPQTVTLDGVSTFAGIPGAAIAGRSGKLEAHLWPGLSWQMANGNRSGFVRPLATYSVPAVTVHRWALADGSTRPVTAQLAGDGSVQLEKAGGPLWPLEGPMLAGSQSRAVTRWLM